MVHVRVRTIFVWVAAFLVLFTIAGFFVAPPIIKSILVKKLSQTLNRQVAVQYIRVNPYLLNLRVGGVSIKEKTGNNIFLRFDELALGLHPSSLFKKALILRKVTLKKPYVRIVLDQKGTYNFSDLIQSQTPVDRGSDKEMALHFSLNNVQLLDGGIDFIDGPKDTLHTVRQMTIHVPFLSNVQHYADVFVRPYFSANINGSTYVLKGKTKPFGNSLESYVDVSIAHLDVARYIAYFPRKINFALASAFLDVDGKVSFLHGKDPALVVSGAVTISDLVVNDLLKRRLLKAPSAAFIVDRLEPLKPGLHLSGATVRGPEVTLRRNKDGSLQLASLFGDRDRPNHRPNPLPENRISPTGAEKRFSFTVDEFQLDGGKAYFEDHSFAPLLLAPLNAIVVRAGKISTEGKEPGTASFSCNILKKGSLAASGSVALNPLIAEISLDLKGIPISPFQPYFDKKIKIAVTKGTLSTTGRLSIQTSHASGRPKISLGGNLFVSGFSSIDQIHGDPLFEWKNLAFTKITAGLDPFHLKIGGIALTDFYSRIIVNADGSTNLHNLVDGEQAETDRSTGIQPEPRTIPGPQSGEPPDIQVHAITLQGGQIDFTDKRIQPSYETELSELTGRVSGISLKKGGVAGLEILGKIEKHIPLTIKGTINPSPKALSVDLTASFHNLDISPMTPYSSRYAGYTIEKGKLSIDVKYMINNRKLDSQNLIFLDQFTFGEKVESPDATGLPVRLAVALLKDRKGQIKLDIPVSGSIDDPKFKIGRVILQILVNLISKAVTSPFTLLASLFGSGEDLGYVEFDYGSSRLDTGGTTKLATLGKALFERPTLKLEVEGRVDPEQDREALRQVLFLKKLKIQKLNDLIAQRLQTVPADDIRIEANEYDKYLTKAYKAEKFPKPRNLMGMTKTIPPSEMEKLMVTNITIKDEDLRALAIQRAKNVTDSLMKQNVPAERLFVLEPKLAPSDGKQAVKNSRVEFHLK